jgi:alanyl-tRNA synthetase
MDVLEIKNRYLEFMRKRGWPTRKSGKLVDSTFPHCFTISGAVDWFNQKLANDPFSKEGFSYWVRCFRHYDIPDKTHLPFFWMLLDVSWDLHSREKAIMDNFSFMKEIGLDPDKIWVSCWQGGKVYGKGIKLRADIEHTCSGPEFEKMRKEGIFIPRDEEAINAWKKCGITDERIVECGEIGMLDPSGFDAILLNAREHFAGVRSEPYYYIKDRHIEIGVYLSEEYVKKPLVLRSNVPQAALEDDINGDKFLLHLKSRPVPAGFGLERMAMAVNNFASIYQIEPYRMIKKILVDKGKLTSEQEATVEDTIAYIPAIVWLIHDGAHLLTTNAVKQRRGIYRGVLKRVIRNLRQLGLDNDNTYLELFRGVINFYLQDDDCRTLRGLEKLCLEEIDKQKKRLKIEERNS